MQLAGFGLIVSALQLCVARHAHVHAHAHIPRHKDTTGCALSSEVGCTPKAVSTRTTTSLLFVEADVDLQYQEVYTRTSPAGQGMETALGKQYRAGLLPTNVGPHYQSQHLSSQGWTEINDANSTWRSCNHSSVHHPTFYATATPLIHSSVKPSISTVSAGGTAGNLHSFSSSGLHGKQGASRFTGLIMILILTGAAVRIWS